MLKGTSRPRWTVAGRLCEGLWKWPGSVFPPVWLFRKGFRLFYSTIHHILKLILRYITIWSLEWHAFLSCFKFLSIRGGAFRHSGVLAHLLKPSNSPYPWPASLASGNYTYRRAATPQTVGMCGLISVCCRACPPNNSSTTTVTDSDLGGQQWVTA